MVSAEQVWAAFEEIPDPEIPVISLVDLGVIRSVDVSNGHVHVEFTPTFLGCPALEVTKRALEETVAGLGGEPDVQVIQDDSWSTDKITPAGREKLRAAGFAPPAPREASAAKAGSGGGGGGAPPPRRCVRQAVGWAVDLILMDPEMMPCFT
jgi:ring-1,2-phenylacetyl-CoA epoxidase subunit PaaD